MVIFMNAPLQNVEVAQPPAITVQCDSRPVEGAVRRWSPSCDSNLATGCIATDQICHLTHDSDRTPDKILKGQALADDQFLEDWATDGPAVIQALKSAN